MNFKPRKVKVIVSVMAPIFFWILGSSFAFLSSFSIYPKSAPVYMIGGFPFRPSCSYFLGGLYSPNCTVKGLIHVMFLEFPVFCIFLMVLTYIIWSLGEKKKI